MDLGKVPPRILWAVVQYYVPYERTRDDGTIKLAFRTHREMAKDFGVAPSRINAWLNGRAGRFMRQTLAGEAVEKARAACVGAAPEVGTVTVALKDILGNSGLAARDRIAAARELRAWAEMVEGEPALPLNPAPPHEPWDDDDGGSPGEL